MESNGNVVNITVGSVGTTAILLIYPDFVVQVINVINQIVILVRRFELFTDDFN